MWTFRIFTFVARSTAPVESHLDSVFRHHLLHFEHFQKQNRIENFVEKLIVLLILIHVICIQMDFPIIQIFESWRQPPRQKRSVTFMSWCRERVQFVLWACRELSRSVVTLPVVSWRVGSVSSSLSSFFFFMSWYYEMFRQESRRNMTTPVSGVTSLTSVEDKSSVCTLPSALTSASLVQDAKFKACTRPSALTSVTP